MSDIEKRLLDAQEIIHGWIGSKPKTEIKTIDFGALPNAAQKSIPHGLTSAQMARVVRIWGIVKVASGSLNVLPMLPQPTAAYNTAIALSLDTNNVLITTGIDRTSMTATVYIEYTAD